MRALSLMVLIASVACSARVVRNPQPGNGSRPGMVKFQVSQIPSIDDKRRADALQKMAESCGGPYRIVSERDRVDHTVVHRQGRRRVHVEPVRYTYIEYSCDGDREPR